MQCTYNVTNVYDVPRCKISIRPDRVTVLLAAILSNGLFNFWGTVTSATEVKKQRYKSRKSSHEIANFTQYTGIQVLFCWPAFKIVKNTALDMPSWHNLGHRHEQEWTVDWREIVVNLRLACAARKGITDFRSTDLLNWIHVSTSNHTQQSQNICITFIQRRPNVFDVGPTLYVIQMFCVCWVCAAESLGVLDMVCIRLWSMSTHVHWLVAHFHERSILYVLGCFILVVIFKYFW